jgi:O-methyltransferase
MCKIFGHNIKLTILLKANRSMVDNTRKLVYGSSIFGKFMSNLNTKFQFRLLSFYNDKKIIDLIKIVKKEVNFAFYPIEAYHVYSIAKSQSNLEGDMAEVGVYQGGSAKLISEVKNEKELHLFDTFEGLPKVSEKDTHFGTSYWKTGEFSNTSLEKVENYLSNYKNIFCYKGKFPDTSEPIKNKKFSFVHLDVDLFQSTIDCLKFFYPRMINGGVILTHDYHTDGVKQAFNEFCKDKKIPQIQLLGSQCIITKLE